MVIKNESKLHKPYYTLIVTTRAALWIVNIHTNYQHCYTIMFKHVFLNLIWMNTSCRSCGQYLIPVLHCAVCMESISWICNSCERLKDVTHRHTMVAQDGNRREDWHFGKWKEKKHNLSSVISYKSYIYSHIPCMWMCEWLDLLWPFARCFHARIFFRIWFRPWLLA